MQMEKSEVCAISDRPKITCQLCDKVGHSAKQCFRNKGNDVRDSVRCYQCGKYGHKKAVCRSKQKKLDKPGRTRAATGYISSVKSPDNNDIDMISSVNLLENYVQIKIGHLNCSALCDSGADINVIHEQFIRNVACKSLYLTRNL